MQYGDWGQFGLNLVRRKKWINNYPDKLLLQIITQISLYQCVNAFTGVNLQHNWANLNTFNSICNRVNRINSHQ